MPGPWIHDIDPILGTAGGFYLWWYGLGYTLGFLEMHLFLRRRRDRLQLSLREVYSLTLFLIVGVLVGGRFVEVAFDEWPFYSQRPWLIPAYWLGGMATHGILLGAAVATIAFAFLYRVSLLALADELVIPGALLMGLGRLGNFIDGQIVGRPTDGWWGVKFPDAEGFRHPVVLYDGLKNLLLVPYLLHVRRTNPTPGATAAQFIFWYAFLRLFIDLFRDYPTHRLVLGTGQTLNIAMTLLGAVLLYRSRLRRLGRLPTATPTPRHAAEGPRGRPLVAQQIALVALLLLCLVMPSNWTQDVPARYGKRHPGLEHSWRYPAIDTRPPAARGSAPTRP
jgi:phosphatidylglycerol:prolipoprotein diacylglycerol transferase